VKQGKDAGVLLNRVTCTVSALRYLVTTLSIRGVVVRERYGTPFRQIFWSRDGAPANIVGHRWNAITLKRSGKSRRIVRFIGADSTGATGNFAPVLKQEPGQTLHFAPVPFMEPVL